MTPLRKLPLAGAATLLLLAAGCSRTDNEPGPGGVTVGEAKALDDAAAMLESRESPPGDEPANESGKTPPQS